MISAGIKKHFEFLSSTDAMHLSISLALRGHIACRLRMYDAYTYNAYIAIICFVCTKCGCYKCVCYPMRKLNTRDTVLSKKVRCHRPILKYFANSACGQKYIIVVRYFVKRTFRIKSVDQTSNDKICSKYYQLI